MLCQILKCYTKSNTILISLECISIKHLSLEVNRNRTSLFTFKLSGEIICNESLFIVLSLCAVWKRLYNTVSLSTYIYTSIIKCKNKSDHYIKNILRIPYCIGTHFVKYFADPVYVMMYYVNAV